MILDSIPIGETILGDFYVSGEPVWVPYSVHMRGQWGFLTPLSVRVRGVNRGIEDDSLRGFLLFVGEGEDPDLDGEPTETGTTLPLEFEVPEAGEYRVVLQARNAFGVRSGNTLATAITVADNEVGVPAVGAVDELRAVASGWYITATGVYLARDGEEFPPVELEFEFSQLGSGSPVVHADEVAIDVTGDGAGTGSVSVEMDDLTAFPAQTGVVEVRVRARRSESDYGAWLGPIEVAVPGASVAMVRGAMIEAATGVAFREDT